MCEVLIRVHDKSNPDPYLDVGCLKRGDVVCVVPDNWGWSSEEKTNSDWRILKLPNVSVSFANAFVTPEVDATGNPLNKMLQKRGIKLDLNNVSLTNPQKAFLADDSRASPWFTLNVSESQLWNLKIVKIPVPDPSKL